MAQYSLSRLRPEYVRLWEKMVVTNRAGATLDAQLILRGKNAYLRIERECNVPWWFAGLTHLRESRCNFATWLHNGDPMRDRNGNPIRTRQVPKGRPPDPSVDFFGGAYDALVTLKRFNLVPTWGPEHAAYSGEAMNGFGYRRPEINIPSPYLWGGTNIQKRGKYIRDHVFDANAWDTQLGVMAVLKILMELDSDVAFGPVGTRGGVPQEELSEDVPDDWVDGVPPEPEDEVEEMADDVPPMPPARSPRAIDPPQRQIKPLRRSRTIWGGITSWLGGVGASVMGMFSYLATPWGFAIFMVLVVLITIGTYLVITGRINTQKLVAHLSPDDDGEEEEDWEEEPPPAPRARARTQLRGPR